MTKLINAMSAASFFKPFRWPICEGANATAPRRSSYPECPEGTESIALCDLSSGCINRSNQNIVALEPRAAPWSFDMKSEDGTATRHWFSVTR